MTPGEYLRHVRHNAGLTLQQVATASGYSVSQLSNMESGVRSMPKTRTKLIALCQAYGADSDRLEGYIVQSTGVIDLRDLSPSERFSVIDFVAGIRRGRCLR